MSPAGDYRGWERHVSECLDTLEVLPRKGCNAGGCRRRVIETWPAYIGGPRRLCRVHVKLYREHDRLVARILEIPARPLHAI
jgi:hypothetical protein